MHDSRQLFRCRCGYQLFESQSCPECGRKFEEAVAQRFSWRRWVFPIIVVLLMAISPVLLLQITTYGHSSGRAMLVALQSIGIWFGLFVLLIGYALGSGFIRYLSQYRVPPYRIATYLATIGLVWSFAMLLWGVIAIFQS